MNNEILTIYNCFNTKIGVALRENVHKSGLWHRAISFIVLEPETRDIIFQDTKGLEIYDKDDFFLKLNGGHISQNDDVKSSFRELKEELGLIIHPKDALHIGNYQLSVQFSEDFKNNEFIYFYIIPVKNAFEKIVFEDGEVGSIIKFNVDEAIEMLLKKRNSIAGTARDAKTRKEVTLKPAHLKNFTDDNLYLRIMIAAKRFLDGEDKELILL